MKSEYNKKWIIETALPIIDSYEPGVLTIRGLHYLLVSQGMTNDMLHYRKVVTAMISARWEGDVNFNFFVDNDRDTVGFTNADIVDLDSEIEEGKNQVRLWLQNYRRSRWENQEHYPEVFIEKKALQGVFKPICQKYEVALNPCKGYPSLTFLYDAAKRFKNRSSEGKTPVILYFGDYDPSGEDIPRSIEKNLWDLGVEDLVLKRFALLENQVVDWSLPPAPAKKGDPRSANWDGLGQVELDAVEPKKLQRLCTDAIKEFFDTELYDELMTLQDNETPIYREELKDYIRTL